MAPPAPGARSAPPARGARPAPPAPAKADPPAPRRSRLRVAERAILLGAIAFGVVTRILVLHSSLGALDSDEAVVGLIARGLVHGTAWRGAARFPVLFWGQNYGGSLEAVGAALVFLVHSSTLALKAVPVTLSAVAAVLTWRIGRRIVGPVGGRFAGVLFWAWPPSFVWWSTKAGVYWAALCCTLAAVLLLARTADRVREGIVLSGTVLGDARETVEFAGLGLATGLAWWANPQSLYLLVPAYVWFAPALSRRWRYLPVLGATALAGAAPWVGYNLVHHWASLRFPPQAKAAGTYGTRFSAFFSTALPMALGWKIPYDKTWLLGPVGMVGYGATLAGLAACLGIGAIRHRQRRLLFLGLAAVAYPFLFATSPLSWYVDHPRYLLFLAPVVAVLAGAGLARGRVRLPGMAVAAVLTVAGLASMTSSGLFAPNGPDIHVPASLAPLEAMLSTYAVHDAYADYWLAYRTTFETGSSVLVAPTWASRSPSLDAAVAASPHPAYLFLTKSATLAGFEQAAGRLGVTTQAHSRGAFTVVLPASRILPGQTGVNWNP